MIVSDDIDQYLRRNTASSFYSPSSPGPTGPKGDKGDAASLSDIKIKDNGLNINLGDYLKKLEIEIDALKRKKNFVGINGTEGINGLAGRDGVTGPAGRDGATGPPGRDSLNGVTGPAGKDGIGATGPAGKDGVTGPAGVGATGPAGNDGVTGPAGKDGVTGPAGVGATGPAGIGATGPAGKDGVTGPEGVGLTGPKGEPGIGINLKGSVQKVSDLPAIAINGDAYIVQDLGNLFVSNNGNWIDVGKIQGPPGKDGVTGPIGSTGPASVGATGPTGDKPKFTELIDESVLWRMGIDKTLRNFLLELNDRSSTGSTGIGPTGERGPTGEKGADGITGFTGERGPTGEKGADGITGYTGERGPTGEKPTINDLLKSQFTLNGIDKNLEGYLIDLQGMGLMLKNHEGRITILESIQCTSTGCTGIGKDGATGPTGANGIGKDGATGPTGADGKPGIGINLKGSVETKANLVLPATNGDAYIVQDNGNLFVANDNAWIDVGKIQGPPGKDGQTGPTGGVPSLDDLFIDDDGQRKPLKQFLMELKNRSPTGYTGTTQDLSGILARLDNMESIVGKTKIDFTINVLDILCNHYSGANLYKIGLNGEIIEVPPEPIVPITKVNISQLLDVEPLPDYNPPPATRSLIKIDDPIQLLPDQDVPTFNKSKINVPENVQELNILDPIGSIKSIFSNFVTVEDLPPQSVPTVNKQGVKGLENVDDLPPQVVPKVNKQEISGLVSVDDLPPQVVPTVNKQGISGLVYVDDLPPQVVPKVNKQGVKGVVSVDDLPPQVVPKVNKQRVKGLESVNDLPEKKVPVANKIKLNPFENIKDFTFF